MLDPSEDLVLGDSHHLTIDLNLAGSDENPRPRELDAEGRRDYAIEPNGAKPGQNYFFEAVEICFVRRL
jgi:hypothetical protein